MYNKKRSGMRTWRRCLLASSFLIASSTAFAESDISGTVVDAKGNPLAGVVVRVEGSKKGTITDGNGRYSIDATPSQCLQFSFLGFTSQTVKAGQSSQVVLQEDDKTLNREPLSLP